MNAPVTHAAEGLPRRAFTVKDVLAMVDAGILGRDERFELIGGEIVPMSPRGIRHERLKVWLCTWLIENRDRSVTVAQETSLILSQDTLVEPDFVLFPSRQPLEELSAADCLLVIEVSDSSIGYDLGKKIEIYASHSVAEVWVINARTLQTTVHRDPADGGYKIVRVADREEALEAALLPGMRLRMDRFDRP